ncbi:hypothetical protein BaRGS_00004034 [Batillaria attramentaria]|uniref:Uncharacterized protein n=1 Tax=Batillaria attramentaria TaxID=370345 RepID=A0ABD0LYM2_9CAEN
MPVTEVQCRLNCTALALVVGRYVQGGHPARRLSFMLSFYQHTQTIPSLFEFLSCLSGLQHFSSQSGMPGSLQIPARPGQMAEGPGSNIAGQLLCCSVVYRTE